MAMATEKAMTAPFRPPIMLPRPTRMMVRITIKKNVFAWFICLPPKGVKLPAVSRPPLLRKAQRRKPTAEFYE